MGTFADKYVIFFPIIFADFRTKEDIIPLEWLQVEMLINNKF